MATFLLWALIPQGADAAVEVYASARDDGVPSPTVEVRGGHALVHVWFNGGYQGDADQDCPATSQDEICGWIVDFQTSGNLVIVDVAWSELVMESAQAPPAPRPVTSIRGEGGIGSAHVGPTKIATVAVAGSEGELRLTTQSVNEGFLIFDSVTRVQVPDTTLAVTPYMPWTTISLSGGGLASACGVLGNGELRCWGEGVQVGSVPSGAYRQVATATDAACALDYAGAISCWGMVSPPPSATYLQVAGGDEHFCGLRPDLEIECWDGAGTISGPIPAGPFRMVSRGASHTCALRLDGTAACWGENGAGQAAPPLQGTFIDLAGGVDHTCALAPNGDAECWGDNTQGEAPPLGVVGPFVEISAGTNRTCAIHEDPEVGVVCWGDGFLAGSMAGSFVALSAGNAVNCGIHDDGSAECWDTGSPGNPPDAPYPQIAAGVYHACQVKGDSKLACWGSDSQGQVSGAGGGSDTVAVASGSDFTCATRRIDPSPGNLDRPAMCWGNSSSGQTFVPGMGYGTGNFVSGGYTQLAAGSAHACGLLHDGTADCWGNDSVGQISGNPSVPLLAIDSGEMFLCGLRTSDRGIECWGSDTFGQVSGAPAGTGFVALSAGGSHACALDAAGAVSCWGSNIFGEASPPPGTFTDVQAGGAFTCGLRADDTPVCWGHNGPGAEMEAAIPLVHPYAAITGGGHTMGEGFACGAAREGGLICWGDDDDAQAVPPFELEGSDGVEDSVDNCPGVDNGPVAGTCTASTGMGIGLACYAHTDCDPGGFCSRFQEDGDFDGVGDACDNCLVAQNPQQFAQNPQQFDRDDDGEGDTCDATPDGEVAEIQVVPVPGGAPFTGGGGAFAAASAGGGAAATSSADSYEVRLTCPDTVQMGRVQFGLVLPPEANAPTAKFGGTATMPGCDLPANGGCTNVPGLGPTVYKQGSFIARGSQISGANPNTIFFSLIGVDTCPGAQVCPDLCASNPVEVLAVVELHPNASLSTTQPATLSQSNSALAKAASCDTAMPPNCPYDDPPQPVQDPSGAVVEGTNWAYVAGGTADVKVLVSPAIAPNGGRDWVLKLESPVELRRIKIGFEDPTGDFQMLGCDATDCCDPGTCTAGVCSDAANSLLGPSVDLCASRAEYVGGLIQTLYVVLEGDLNAASFLGDPTLLHTPNQALSRVTLGTLRVLPPAPAYVAPGFKLEGIEQVDPDGPPFVIPGSGTPPGSGNEPYPYPVGLTGSGEQSEDADGDLISNDTDNCVVYGNRDQVDVGGLHLAGKAPPKFDGVGDGCQCGDVSDGIGDGRITPPGSPSPSDLGDVRELQDVLAGVPLDTDPQVAAALSQAARARCSVSGVTTGAGEPVDCDIKDALTLALAIAGKVPGVSAVCSRNTPGQPLHPNP